MPRNSIFWFCLLKQKDPRMGSVAAIILELLCSTILGLCPSRICRALLRTDGFDEMSLSFNWAEQLDKSLKIGALRIKPRVAGWQVRTLPLCSAVLDIITAFWKKLHIFLKVPSSRTFSVFLFLVSSFCLNSFHLSFSSLLLPSIFAFDPWRFFSSRALQVTLLSLPQKDTTLKEKAFEVVGRNCSGQQTRWSAL